ncbi:acetyl-CoA hydrolase/transferase family protein [Clostridium scatologenes]|uniref:Acetyl-CoA hydrolase n=1 Tax=Clostridium scatologenes TaxID=1548 RepID=A0A0E3K4I7_CLOSL|nr:acetyl-CoA hydrolase/transferase family protein [Clostridium scatologenes]AKA72414.1 Acetyl-CoA hydrolase [Clostridium scatologenes]
MIDIKDRVRNKALHSKIVTAEEAAAIIKPNMNVGVSGFTPSGYPKAVPLALAERMKKEKFKINLWTGASVGSELDGALSEANGISRRLPYQTNKSLRNKINNGEIQYVDLHLSHVAQMVRYGFLDKVDVAIVEACAITEEGYIIPTTSLGNTASYVQSADIVIVEINTTQPLELEGMHDVYIPMDPPNRVPIPLIKINDRIGTTYIPVDHDKITYIVPCDRPDVTRSLSEISDDDLAISSNLIDFFNSEVKHGRLPKNLLPLQSGVGSVANAVTAGIVRSQYTHLNVYTEVIQDGMFDLIDAGKLDFASGTALSPSPEGLKRFYENIDEYRNKILLRPQEISNNPGIARRLGVIAMNTAIEFDIYGNVNSSHIMGSKMMNGIGGSGDFARNGYLTIFFTKSTAKNGAISSIVPMCSHVDHTEHDTDVFITELGIADVRGLSPKERARVIINNCVHPDYKPMLVDYLERAEKETGFAHTPNLLDEALSWHSRFLSTKSMKLNG